MATDLPLSIALTTPAISPDSPGWAQSGRASASCAISAECDGCFPHPHRQRVGTCGSDGGREAIMHPAGKHFHCDRLGPSWTDLLQVAAFAPLGELGQRRFQYIQITDHAPAVQLLAVHDDLNPIVMIM